MPQEQPPALMPILHPENCPPPSFACRLNKEVKESNSVQNEIERQQNPFAIKGDVIVII
jgi:hypothetical protein